MSWKNKSEFITRRPASIHWRSRCSRVIQGLLQELMIHRARCNNSCNLDWLAPPSAGCLLTPLSKGQKAAEVNYHQGEHAFVVKSVLKVTLGVNRERPGSPGLTKPLVRHIVVNKTMRGKCISNVYISHLTHRGKKTADTDAPVHLWNVPFRPSSTAMKVMLKHHGLKGSVKRWCLSVRTFLFTLMEK